MHESTIVYVLDEDCDSMAPMVQRLRRAGYTVRMFADPVELVNAYKLEPAHCIVTEMLTRSAQGFALAEQIRAINPAVAIVFMTARPSARDAVDAIRHHGAFDYLEKPIDEQRLKRSIGEACSWSVAHRRIVSRLATLSCRERDVFQLLTRGMSNKAIANHLGISMRTVEAHRAKIASKTGTKNLEEMIALTQTRDHLSPTVKSDLDAFRRDAHVPCRPSYDV